MANNKNYYDILGVDKSSSSDDVKKAFRKKAHQYHPDKKTGDEAKFKEINEAYQVLGNEKKRKQYDQFGTTFDQGQGPGAGGYSSWQDMGGFSQGNMDFDDLGDIFSGMGDIFGFGGARGGSRSQARGSDLQMTIAVELEDVVFGSEKNIELKKNVVCDHCEGSGAEPGSDVKTCDTCQGKGEVITTQRTILGNMQARAICPDCQGEGKTYSQTCKKCHGEGRRQEKVKLTIKIPAGIDTGQSIRLSGQGEAGPKGAPAGDLFIKIKVNDHANFTREGDDIRSTKELKFSQLVLGDKVEVDTIDGKVILKIPEGAQSGTVFKLKAKGVNHLQSRGRGDHLVKVLVKTPKNLTKKQKEAVKELDI
ncbi:MAG TPA: molecular chaperone DnaJ [Patescibacteria group bacterium]|nr:molecular chaperone DnaJ [Patescibacteria group bacterium]